MHEMANRRCTLSTVYIILTEGRRIQALVHDYCFGWFIIIVRNLLQGVKTVTVNLVKGLWQLHSVVVAAVSTVQVIHTKHVMAFSYMWRRLLGLWIVLWERCAHNKCWSQETAASPDWQILYAIEQLVDGHTYHTHTDLGLAKIVNNLSLC